MVDTWIKICCQNYEIELVRIISGLVIVVIAACSDLDKRKVSNRLILAGMLWGCFLAWQCRTPVIIYIAGGLMPLLLLWALFLIRAIGSGDIKLFMLIGWLTGIAGVSISLAASFVWAALWGIILLIKNRIILGSRELTKIPFAVAVFLGYMTWMIWSSV